MQIKCSQTQKQTWQQWFNRMEREYSLCAKKTKITSFNNYSLLRHRPLPSSRVPLRMRVHSSARKQGAEHACSLSAPHTDVVILWIMVKNSDAEEKKSLKSLLLFSLSEMCFRQHVNTELIPLSHLLALEIHTHKILSKYQSVLS